MAASVPSKENKAKGGAKKASLIDPIYQKYTRSVLRALGSTEFYEFFMDALSRAENEIQFSNRKLVKTVDLTWVDAVEDSLEGFQEIISSPRNVIKEEELIVNIANAKKAGSDTVRHLAQHGSLVEDYNVQTGEVRPSKLMQRFREDSIGIYENALVYTTLEHAFHFVKIRHDALFGAMSDEFGAKLKVHTNMETATELVHLDMFLHIKNTDDTLKTDEKNADTFSRISRIYRVLSVYMNSQFSQQLRSVNRVKGTIHKTNVLKRNPNYKKIVKLFEFLREYDDIGYTIKVVEQNPEVTETFQRDIFLNTMFQYLVLKGYLEDEEDRQTPAPAKEKKRTLKPKFIHQIIEELTEDYDLPDVEVRKVLIEELTKAQLMQEEAAERRRLVEEQQQRKKAEAERLRKEKEAEKERIRQEKEAEKERIRQEQEAEKQRLKQERMEREAEDRRRSKRFKKDLAAFHEGLQDRLEARRQAAEKEIAQQQDYLDAAQLLEEAEQRKLEAAERKRKRMQEAREKAKREKLLAEERARREAQERIERARREKEEQEERERQERLAAEEAQREALRQQAIVILSPVIEEVKAFHDQLGANRQRRADYIDAVNKLKAEWEAARRERQARRSGQS